ncbi:dapper homolog 2 [Coregonus clupeaformis]|uniref:dapper homolog 2 n=1 Tax=Coregonus clupeaformis TaxID=59861 RepID=UPI001BDF7FC4|nr:dapper homolog 2 [Coregonus clupeaformis]
MAAGIDHGRVGERLQAALAGLQELHFLKEKQCDMVNWALRMDRTDRQGTEEQHLEATLSALKQELSHLRRQDVGQKTHLQQLDQQISDLKLDVCKASTEQMESNSRPSSGFYDLSDCGSCSLSNSCTSVYSECLSSSSQTSLLPPHGPSGPHTLSTAAQKNVASRRRSVDETSTHPNPPRGTGLHLGSSRIRTGTAGTDWARQRPMSTGDLDRMLTPGLGSYKSVDVKKSSLCSNLWSSTTVDPKYQSNLVSRNGAEVYLYPSPLHAIALQSPIFSLGWEPAVTEAPDGQGPPADAFPSVETLQRGRKERMEPKPLGYINKLRKGSMSKINVRTEFGRDNMQMPQNDRPSYPHEADELGTVSPDVPQVQVPPQQQAMLSQSDIRPMTRQRQSASREQVNYVNLTRQALRTPFLETSYRYSYPAALRGYRSSELHTTTSTINIFRVSSDGVSMRGHPDLGHVEVPGGGGASERKPSERRLVPSMGVAHSSSTEESQGSDEGSLCHHLAQSGFVHAQFVPAGSQWVKLRQADRKSKAVRLRRRSCEKPSRAMRLQLQGHSSNERTRETSVGARGERELRVPERGRMSQSQRPASCLMKECGHSGSESSLCGPALSYAQPLAIPATKPTKPRRPHYPDLDQPPIDQRKRRQGTPKWPSDMEMSQAMWVQDQMSHRGLQTGGPVSKSAIGWGEGGPPRALQPFAFSSSYFSHLNARYPPAPYPLSTHYLSLCESEYSADCTSLFHSNITESSEGDSESSQSESQSHSDSDRSLSLDKGSRKEGGLVWAEAALGPIAAGRPLQQLPRPEPPARRIKASRVLKKKIRRFQPASMKVMTLV